MNSKTVQLATNPEATTIDGMWAFSVEITFDILIDWCLGLALLKEKLIDSIIVLGASSKHVFTLKLETHLDKLIAVEKTEKGFKIELGQNALELLTHYYLTYYRDGQADVNHIDLETIFEGKEAYLTFYAEHSKAALTPSDLTRLIGKQ